MTREFVLMGGPHDGEQIAVTDVMTVERVSDVGPPMVISTYRLDSDGVFRFKGQWSA